MIDSYDATFVVVSFVILFGVILPILGRIPYVRDFVSLRWSIVVVYSAFCLGVIIDFGHLDTSVRLTVVIGGIILSALFLIIRSYEKAAIHHWGFPNLRGQITHGDTAVGLSITPKLEVEKETQSQLETQPQDKENKNELPV